MTNEIRRATAVDLAPDAPVFPDDPQPLRRMDGDTMFAISATIVGVLCVLISAIGLISVCVAPLGMTAVVFAVATAAAIAAVLLAGGFWVWIRDRGGRGRYVWTGGAGAPRRSERRWLFRRSGRPWLRGRRRG